MNSNAAESSQETSLQLVIVNKDSPQEFTYHQAEEGRQEKHRGMDEDTDWCRITKLLRGEAARQLQSKHEKISFLQKSVRFITYLQKQRKADKMKINNGFNAIETFLKEKGAVMLR